MWLPQKRIQYQLNILCCKISNLNEIMQARFLYNILTTSIDRTTFTREWCGSCTNVCEASRIGRYIDQAAALGAACLWWNVRALVICLSAIAREWKRRYQLRKTTNKDLLLTTGVRIGRWRIFRANEGERHGKKEEETIGRSLYGNELCMGPLTRQLLFTSVPGPISTPKQKLHGENID